MKKKKKKKKKNHASGGQEGVHYLDVPLRCKHKSYGQKFGVLKFTIPTEKAKRRVHVHDSGMSYFRPPVPLRLPRGGESEVR